MNFGAFIISLDLEAMWGMRDHLHEGDSYARNIEGERQAISRMLELFEEYRISATWGTVGFLFADGCDEATRYAPLLKPHYHNVRLNPYNDVLGASESADPLHFAPSLLRAIAACPGQEIASHTFSHYYCLEAGQQLADFRADLFSAQRIANDKGFELRSLILPRNQINPEYAAVIRDAGFTCYRGNPPLGWHGEAAGAMIGFARRAYRLADSFIDLSGPQLARWDTLREPSGLVNARASAFLRPYSPKRKILEPLRLRRIETALAVAARERSVFHLWWHPHNFGIHQSENIDFLRRVLETFSRLRKTYDMRSLTMGEVAQLTP